MKNLIYSIFILLGVVSCSKPYIDKPDDLLSKSEMIDILADIYMGTQMVNATPNTNSILKLAQSSMYVFDKHETSYKIFEESYKYYYIDPSAYQKILDEVKKELESRLSEDEKNRLEEMKKKAQAE